MLKIFLLFFKVQKSLFGYRTRGIKKNQKYFEKFGKFFQNKFIMPSPIIFVGKEKKFEAIHLQPGQTHKIKLPLKYNKFGITHHVSFGHSFMQRAIHKLHSQHFGVFSIFNNLQGVCANSKAVIAPCACRSLALGSSRR